MSDQPNVEVYSPEKVKGDEYDAIVIGSGIGGLSVASLLAQAGKKVLVLEQNNIAGGCCQTFVSNGYEFATGIHYIGEMHEGSEFKEYLDALTPVDDPVEWDRWDDHFETDYIGDPPIQYKTVAGEKELKRELLERFPDEEKAIEKYFKAMKKGKKMIDKAILFKCLPLPLASMLTRTGLYKVMDGGYHKWVKQSVEEKLNKWTKNKDLQAVLAVSYPDYGTEPSRTPFLLQPLVTKHYLNGAYYPRGGSSTIPKKVIQSITGDEGKVLVSASVEGIMVDAETGEAKGVKMQDGHVIESNVVISDAGLINTATKLLPPGLVDIDFADVGTGEHQLHLAATGITVFVGLKGDPESLELPKHGSFIHVSNDFTATAERLRGLSLDEALQLDAKEFSPIGVSFPSSGDSTWAKRYPGKSTMEIIAWLPWQWFEKFQSTYDEKTKSHGAEYEAAKSRIAEKLWERVVQVLEPTGAKLPQTLDGVDHYEVATPLTWAHFLKSEHGAYYGLDHDMKRFAPKTYFLRLRPEIPEVPGVYLTGQDIVSDGLVSAAMGGVLCAARVLGISNPKALVKHSKERSKGKVAHMEKPAVVAEQALPEELAELAA